VQGRPLVVLELMVKDLGVEKRCTSNIFLKKVDQVVSEQVSENE
jgi:hypothetical protein